MLQRAVLIRFMRWLQRLWLISMLLLFAAPAYSSDEAPGAGTVIFLPPGNLYPPSLANPQRVGFGVQWLNFTHTEIPDSGDSRVALRAGGQFGIVRVDPSGAGDRHGRWTF